jgi:hypothetical protein
MATVDGARDAVLGPAARPVGRQLAGDVAGGGATPAAHPRGHEDFETAQGLAATVPGAVYPGTEHYFASTTTRRLRCLSSV